MKDISCILKKRRGDAPLVKIGRSYQIEGAVGESDPRAPNDIDGARGERAEGRLFKRETGSGGASFKTGSRFESRIPGGPAGGVK